MPYAYAFLFARTRSREPDYYLIEESNAHPRAWWEYTHRCTVQATQKMIKGQQKRGFPSVGDVISTIDGRTVEVLTVETLTISAPAPVPGTE